MVCPIFGASGTSAAKLRKRFPWLLEGTDFYDGGHVICNRTAAAVRPAVRPAGGIPAMVAAPRVTTAEQLLLPATLNGTPHLELFEGAL